jgi:hypothetical protein
MNLTHKIEGCTLTVVAKHEGRCGFRHVLTLYPWAYVGSGHDWETLTDMVYTEWCLWRMPDRWAREATDYTMREGFRPMLRCVDLARKGVVVHDAMGCRLVTTP